MTDNEFDRIIKDRLEGYSEEAPDVWAAIQKRGASRRRWRVVRRTAAATAAAAACLAAGLFLFRDGEPRTGGPSPVAQAEAPVIESSQPEVISMEEQVSALAGRGVTALAAEPVRKPAAAFTPAEPVKPAEQTAEVPAEDAPQTELLTAEQPATPVQESAESPAAPAEDHLLTSEDIPESFWNEEEPGKSFLSEHTSQISILSNISSVAHEGTFIYENGPMHSSSQLGLPQANGAVLPMDNAPKFFAPVALGLQFKAGLTDRLSVGAGVSYSYLVSQYDALVNMERFEGLYSQLHYVGVPVNLYWNFVNTGSLGVYVSAGAAAEKCVSQRYVFGSRTLHEKVAGLQYSVSAGLGVEYWFVPRLGIYVDPAIVYYFDNSQPLSVRTQQPIQARFEAGFRFKL